MFSDVTYKNHLASLPPHSTSSSVTSQLHTKVVPSKHLVRSHHRATLTPILPAPTSILFCKAPLPSASATLACGSYQKDTRLLPGALTLAVAPA